MRSGVGGLWTVQWKGADGGVWGGSGASRLGINRPRRHFPSFRPPFPKWRKGDRVVVVSSECEYLVPVPVLRRLFFVPYGYPYQVPVPVGIPGTPGAGTC